jgi:16S rRNA (cytidine1402-2'-O)-methyltransferase
VTAVASPEAGRGTLYVVGTPIGNLEDLSPRAAATIAACRLIAAEDTRRTRLMMRRQGLAGRVVSYHRFNEASRAAELLDALAAGASVALVTDAGTPGISDPGSLLVRRARAEGHRVVPVPGPSAVTALLSVSGFPPGPFTFVGFLPSRRAARRAALEALVSETRPLLFFEAPHRVLSMLDDLIAVLGDRDACLGREMTKLHEEFLDGALASIRTRLASGPVRGEISLLVAGAAEGTARGGAAGSPAGTPGAEVLRLLASGWERSKALRHVARERGLPRREVYRDLLRARREPGDDGEGR